MWNEFNNCWLAVLQKQKEMTQEMQATGQQPPPTRSMIEYNYMEHMGRELVRLCDLMEKHGLVDYQLGVWEEEILSRQYSEYSLYPVCVCSHRDSSHAVS